MVTRSEAVQRRPALGFDDRLHIGVEFGYHLASHLGDHLVDRFGRALWPARPGRTAVGDDSDAGVGVPDVERVG